MTFRVFDGFCKAGGAGAGYTRAGAEVFGMDWEPQPRNPHEFKQGDVMEILYDPIYRHWLRNNFDLLHFSPPCQGYTEMNAPGMKGAPRLIPEVRELAKLVGLPYIIENVFNARKVMVDPVILNGRMFHLHAPEGHLLRKRAFECSFPVDRPFRQAVDHLPIIGIYGGHCRIRSKKHGGRGTSEAGWLKRSHLELASELMDIDWMNMDELSEAIPPAYTQYLAQEFLRWRSLTS